MHPSVEDGMANTPLLGEEASFCDSENCRGQCGWGRRGGDNGAGGVMGTGMSQRLCNFLQTFAAFTLSEKEKTLGALGKEETQPDLHFKKMTGCRRAMRLLQAFHSHLKGQLLFSFPLST